MKKKTEEKRQHILDAASDVFQEYGFERASMSEIRKRVGGSKATLYNYFSSKEELFFEAVFRTIEAEFEAVHSGLDASSNDISKTLCSFGEKLLTFLYTPNMLANRKLTITESTRTNLGKIVYERGLSRCHVYLESFINEAIRLKKLKHCDTFVAVKHLSALLESEILMPALLNVKVSFTQEEIKDITARAVDVFIAAYGLKS